MDTPALCVDLPTLRKNIGIAAAYCGDRGVHLRPHFKTHKCTEIAKMQLAAGAIGISCTTLDEAAALTRAGIRNVLLTSPLIGTSKLDRLDKLLTSAPGPSRSCGSPYTRDTARGALRGSWIQDQSF